MVGAGAAMGLLAISVDQVAQAIMTGESGASKAVQESGRYGELLHNIWGDWIGGVLSVVTLDLQGALFAWKDAGDSIDKFFGRGEAEAKADARQAEATAHANAMNDRLETIAGLLKGDAVERAKGLKLMQEHKDLALKRNEIAEEQVATEKKTVRHGRMVANAAPN